MSLVQIKRFGLFGGPVQLGTGRLQDQTVPLRGYNRKRMLAATGNLEKRYRQEASKLVDELLLGWRELGAR